LDISKVNMEEENLILKERVKELEETLILPPILSTLVVGASLIKTGSFSGYRQKVPSSLECWHFHLFQREEVSPEALLRQIDREG
jgi:hypothetical protein